jgi:hypothetical protein|tara:strand:- start:3487 stop:3846 length:360 start_codon:yes stop_codon:yes gene_type:complete
MAKTLTSLIEKECANYTGGGCIGVNFRNQMFNSTGICTVIKNKKPCDFFRDCALPLAKHEDNFSKIINDYGKNDKPVKPIKIRLCGCGNTLKKRERFCDKCRISRRKKTYKKNNEKRVV